MDREGGNRITLVISARAPTSLIQMTSRGALVFLAAIVLGGMGWLGWRMAEAPQVEVPKTVHRTTPLKAPRSPAPKIDLPILAFETPRPLPPQPEGPLTRLFADPAQSFRLSPTQLQAYLAANKRNAESLLTATRLTGELEFLQEAARRFPADPRVQLELALRSEVPEERKRALEALRQADPENALADYLAAFERLREGDPDAAFSDLIRAAAKSRLDIYAAAAIQGSEEAYLAAGFTPVEAKAAAILGLPHLEVDPLQELAKQLAALQTAYADHGDASSAEAVRQMGHALSQQLQSDAQSILHEVVGMSTEQLFLDPANAATRQHEIQQHVNALVSLSSNPKMRDLMLRGSVADISLYLDRVKFDGETAAIRWWVER